MTSPSYKTILIILVAETGRICRGHNAHLTFANVLTKQRHWHHRHPDLHRYRVATPMEIVGVESLLILGLLAVHATAMVFLGMALLANDLTLRSRGTPQKRGAP